MYHGRLGGEVKPTSIHTAAHARSAWCLAASSDLWMPWLLLTSSTACGPSGSLLSGHNRPADRPHYRSEAR
eukprot:scaffold489920_cov25-Prasinocladus_malaysianus.AAC.1